MAEGSPTELLMQLLDAGGNPLSAESKSVLADEKTDELAKDFKDGKFFSVDEFAFGMNIDDQDPTADPVNAGGGKGVGVAKKSNSPAPKVKFGKWKTASPEEIENMPPFPVRMDEISIVRPLERASPVLFQSCARATTFSKASLIKRKIVGSGNLQTFLRFDFIGVLVTHVGWDDGEQIKETMRFVFREMQVQYRRQTALGALLAPSQVSWKYDAGLKKK
jgi:type VI protein secretion system component Hcp